jgi:hypothetical protein
MKTKALILNVLAVGLLAVLLLAVAIAGRTSVQAEWPQQGPAVRVMRAGLTPQAIAASLWAEGMNNLGGFEFDLTVDPAVARLTGAQVGDFLGATGRTVGALGPIVGAQGEGLAFGAYSYDPSGQNGPGPSGDGTLAVVTLTVAGEGVSPLTLSNPLFVDVEADPQAVTTADAALQAKALHSGWNLLAPCVDTSGLSVSDTLQSLAGAYDMVLGEGGAYVVGLPEGAQSLHEVAPPWGYYVRVQGSGAVTMTQLSAAFDPHAPIPLTAGWRWVGYCVGASLPVTAALQSIAGQYDMVLGERGAYVAGLPPEFQSLRELRQGAGYLIRMTADGTLVYPAGAQGSQGAEELRSKGAEEQGCTVQPTPYLTLVYGQIEVDGNPAPAGTRVEAVTPRGEVAGCFIVQHEGAFGVMPVYGADADGVTPGFRKGEAIAWRVNGQPAAGPEMVWADEREAHQVRLEVSRAGGRAIYLPVIVK